MNYKTYAWIGLGSFILSLLTIFPIPVISGFFAVLAYTTSAIFTWAFIDIANKTKNTPLKIGSWAFLVISALLGLSSLFGLFGLTLVDTTVLQNTDQIMALGIGVLIAFVLLFIAIGAFSIVAGIGFLRLKDKFGGLATATGVLNIITGVSFVTVIFTFIGLFTVLAAFVIEIIILFKADEAI